MSTIAWNKVNTLTKMSFTEHGKNIFFIPVVVELAVVLAAYIFNSDWRGTISSSVTFTVLISMLIPINITIKQFVGTSQPSVISTIVASAAEKYLSLLMSVIAKSLLWIVVGGITGLLLLVFAGSLFYNVKPDFVLSTLYNDINIIEILLLAFVNALIGLWMISGRNSKKRRYITYASIVFAFIVYFLVVAYFMMTNLEFLYVAVTLYATLVIIFTVVQGYSNFKHIR